MKKLAEVYQDCIDDIDAGKWGQFSEIIKKPDGTVCHCARGLILKNSGEDYPERDLLYKSPDGRVYGRYETDLVDGVYQMDRGVAYAHHHRDVFFGDYFGFIHMNDSQDTPELIRERFEAIRDVAIAEGV